jgi:hypothetical protein
LILARTIEQLKSSELEWQDSKNDANKIQIFFW